MISEDGVAYVQDLASNVIAYDLETGEHKATIGKRGAGPGELFFPTFISLSPRGVYVADTMNARFGSPPCLRHSAIIWAAGTRRTLAVGA